MCDSIANGGPRAVACAPCPPANVIIASNVLSTNGNVISGNIISGDGTFTGNLYVAGQVYGNIIYNSLNIGGVINTATIVAGAYYGNGYGLSNLNASNLTGTVSPANLPASGVTAGVYGDYANVSRVTVDQYGRITTAANVAILSSQWTTVAGNVAYQNGVSIGTLAAPPTGSNLLVLGTANMTTLNVGTLFANSATIFGSQTLNVFGTSNLFFVTGDGGGVSNIRGSAISGNVSSANTALVVTQGFQPNITQVGTLTGLATTGNVSAAFFVGGGNALSNVQSASLVGNVASANTALVVTQGFQPNITQVGTLTGLDVTGTVSAAFFIGGGNALSNIQTGSLIGTVNFANSAGVVTNASQPNIKSLGTLTNLSIIGSLIAGTISGDGQGLYGIHPSSITGTVATANSVVQAAQPNITSVGELTSLNVQGLLIASNGSGISNINASNISSGTLTAARLPTSGVNAGLYGSGSNVSSVTVDQYGRVTSASNIAITASQWTGSVGNPIYYQNFVGIGAAITPTATLQVTGNVYASNSVTTQNLFFTNQIQDTNLPVSGVTAGGYGSVSNIPSLVVDAYGRITGAVNTALPASSQWTSVNSNVAFANGVSIGTLSNPPIGSNLYVLGLATMTNVAGNGAGLSALQASNIVGNVANANVALVVSQPAQPNITSLGPLTGLVVNGLLSSTNGSGIANLTAAAITGNVENANVAFVVSQPAQPNITSLGPLTGLTVNGLLSSTNGSGIANLTAAAITGNVANANVALVVSQPAQPNITSLGPLTGLTVNGLLSSTNGSGIANLTAAAITGNVANANVALVVSQPDQPNITSVGLLSNLEVSNSVRTSNLVSTMINVSTTSNLANLVVNDLTVPGSMRSNTTNTTFFFNTLTIPFINSTTLNVASTSNLDTMTLTGEPGLTTIYTIGNVFISNALQTTNVLATSANIGTLNTASIFGTTSNLATLNSASIFGTTANLATLNAASIFGTTANLANLVVVNSVIATNLFATNGLDVGPGTLGSNVVIFSNAGGGANTFVMDSRGRVSIGAASGPGGSRLSFGQTIENKIITLYDLGNLDNPTSATSFYGFGIIGNAVRYQVPNSITDRHAFYGGSSEYARITSTGISILTGAAPNANLHVAGNIFASNALQTTNVISSNINVSYTANIANLVVTSNILAGPSGNTYITGNVVVSGNVFTSLGTPLGEGGSLYYSLASNYPPPTYTGVLYGQALALSLGTFNEQGSSSLVSRSANGNFRFSKPGIYNIRAIFLTTADNITGIGIGSNASDTTTRTDQTYVYRYTTFVTQNPTEIFDIQFYVGSTTAYYYVDLFAVGAPTLKPTSDPLGGSWLSIGPLQGGGGSGPPVTISTLGAVVTGRTTSYGAGVGDYYIGMSNGKTVNLPIGSSLTAGKQYIIKDESGLAGTFVGYRVTVAASAPDLIDGQDSVILALNYGAINLIWTGSFWSIY